MCNGSSTMCNTLMIYGIWYMCILEQFAQHSTLMVAVLCVEHCIKLCDIIVYNGIV